MAMCCMSAIGRSADRHPRLLTGGKRPLCTVRNYVQMAFEIEVKARNGAVSTRASLLKPQHSFDVRPGQSYTRQSAVKPAAWFARATSAPRCPSVRVRNTSSPAACSLFAAGKQLDDDEVLRYVPLCSRPRSLPVKVRDRKLCGEVAARLAALRIGEP